MIIRYVDRFIWKSSTPNYPLRGYWYQLASKSVTNLIYNSQFSDLRPCNTFIGDNQIRISFDFMTDQERENQYNYVYLYSLDLLQYTSIDEVSHSKNTLLSQLAAIVDLENKESEEHVLNQEVTCIMDLGYLPKCSFLLNSGNKQVQVEHYNSDYVDKINYYSMRVDNQFIDKESGLDYARVNLAQYKPEDLLGNMTIRKSGVIQL